MKTILITAVVCAVIGVGLGWLIFRPSAESESTERRVLYYRDPMNPQSTSPTPKKSSDGMDFVPVFEESPGTSGQRKIAYYKDPMHPWFTSDKPGKAPDCGMDLVPVYEGEGDAKGIRIDPVTIQNIGVTMEPVSKRKLNRTIRTVGTITPDERKTYSVNTKIMGWVEKLFVDYTGMAVKKGDPLLELYSPELVSTQEEYLQALRYRKQLEKSSIAEARKGGDELIESARRRLENWDISDADIRELERRGTPRKTMTFYSPVDGIVMDKMVFKGQNVMAGMDLYRIADLSTVWIMADIYQYELPWVKVGQRAEVELSYLPGKSFKGSVAYVYPMVNMETKTVKVRIEARNTAGMELKPEMYATVKIVSPVPVETVAVPDQAIIRSGERNIVIVALGGGYFDPREVRLGVAADGYVQVLDGIKEGENIVTSSQFLIDSESNLRAAINQMSERASASSASDRLGTSQGQKAALPVAPGGHKAHAMPKDSSSGDSMNMQRSEARSMKARQEDRIDPVCKMDAGQSGKYQLAYRGKTYYFCSEDDLEKFRREPETYITDEG